MIAKEPLDFLHRRVSIGDTVVYPTRIRSGMWMNLGTVTGVYSTVTGWHLTTRRESAARDGAGVPANRCVVVTSILKGEGEEIQ